MLDVVLCELEGVLADTEPLRQEALRRSFADEQLELTPAIYNAHCFALPVESAVRAALRALACERDHTGIELLTVRATRYFSDLASRGFMLAPGAREFLEHTQSSARLGLVTRATRRETELLLSFADLETTFECIITEEEAIFPKPAPAPYVRALERLSRRSTFPKHAIALEYGVPGIHAARTAGLACIAVGTLPAHIQVEADAALPSLAGQTVASLKALLIARKETVG
jgi:beta-phosphoglucomutase-like phosphatase (HAD superfamily)